MFAFLSALVELQVFEEITCNFLLVGHTGNEVDQLFREGFQNVLNWPETRPVLREGGGVCVCVRDVCIFLKCSLIIGVPGSQLTPYLESWFQKKNISLAQKLTKLVLRKSLKFSIVNLSNKVHNCMKQSHSYHKCFNHQT